MTGAITHILSDLGGVFIEIEPAKTLETFRMTGVSDIDQIYLDLLETGVWDDMETGRMPWKDFVALLQARMDEPLELKWFNVAWDAMLLGIPPQRIEIIKHLKQYYRLSIISNTNPRHISSINEYLKLAYQGESLPSLFHSCYYSYEVGMQKPDPAFFQYIIDREGLNPKASLFIDDSQEHVEMADKLGFQTEWVHEGNRFEDIFAWL